MPQHSSTLAEGARWVWRRQSIVWWIFAVNLLLAFTSPMSLSHRIGDVTDHSLAAQRLVNGFDWGIFSELRTTPDVNYGSAGPQSTPAILIFFVFMLFVTGGVLASYVNQYKLSTRDFFATCGEFFWRWVRLLMLMLIVITPLAYGSNAVLHWAGGTLINDAAGEKTGYIVGFACAVITLFLLMAVRLWFDMAQVITVIENQRAMRGSCIRAFKLTASNFGSLFWLYFRISLLAWLGLALGLWLWTRLSGGIAIIMLEFVMLWWVGTRLWQRASEVAWYQSFITANIPAPVYVHAATPEPAMAPAPPDLLPPDE
ncbi:MAG TPA: hypothetical protein VF011_08600 [Terriglobales bacterium]